MKEIIAERNKQEPDGREISKRSISEEPDRDFSATIQIGIILYNSFSLK